MVTTIKLEDVGGESSLLCPNCGDSYLHHGRVEVGDRNEDQPGFRITVAVGASVRIQPETHFRGRGNEVVIAFTCEGCMFSGHLVLRQHKGLTLLSWERIQVSAAIAIDP